MVVVASLVMSLGVHTAAVPPAYRHASIATGVPADVLYVVALVESGRSHRTGRERTPWPWSLNLHGRGWHFPSRATAWRALSLAIAAGERSVDIGLMQVNWRYHGSRFKDPWHALDPEQNLKVAAELLKDCYARRRDWWASVGCYHAPNDAARAARYRQRVLEQWQLTFN